jgi:Raf kinase inhibitor-like YbhB/YbcL family protein
VEIKSVFKNNERIPIRYTADGDNVSPPLEIIGIPKGTKSLVLIVDDPDAKSVIGYTWIHWMRFNISIDGVSFKIEEDSRPGIGGKNSFGKINYGGPSPPVGSRFHNYYFKVYALNIELSFGEGVVKEDVEKSMEDHILEKAELVGVYDRD